LTHIHYFPLGAGVATLFFAILLGLLFFIQIRLLGHAYSALGLDPRVAMLVLFGSLLGSTSICRWRDCRNSESSRGRWWRSSASRFWRRSPSIGRAQS
jgi:uncharacterized membrane protein